MPIASEGPLNAWLRAHDGVISRQEAEQLGISSDSWRRLALSGRLQRAAAGVFVDGALRPNHRTVLRVALVGAGRDAVVSHRSAAWLWGMIDQPPRTPSITIPEGRRVRRADVTIHRTIRPPRPRWHVGFPVTDPPRTVIDLAATMRVEPLDLLIDRALSLRLLTTGHLGEAARCDPPHRRSGARILRQRLVARGLVDVPHPSVLESNMTRVLDRLVRRGGVPVPQREASVLGGRFRLDYAWPTVALAVEVDGYVWHSDPSRMRADLNRRNQLAGAGWTVLVYTWAEVRHDAEAVMSEIEATYRRLASAQRTTGA